MLPLSKPALGGVAQMLPVKYILDEGWEGFHASWKQTQVVFIADWSSGFPSLAGQGSWDALTSFQIEQLFFQIENLLFPDRQIIFPV